MALIHTDTFGVITWHFNVVGCAGDAVVTCGFHSASDNTDDVAIHAFSAMGTLMMPQLSAHASLHRTSVLMQLSGNLESGESFGTGDVAGGQTASMLPTNCAILVQKRTNFAGRKNRGRFFFPGVPGDSIQLNVNGNVLTEAKRASFQTALDSFFDELHADTNDAPIQPVVLHPAGVPVSTEIVAFAVVTTLATQRGRLRN